MTDLAQYVPTKVVGSWATPAATGFGVVDILQGAIDGAFLASTSDNARWTREHDLAGNATRVYNSNRGGSLSITISASSPTNTTLSALAELDDITQSVVGAIVLKDLNGNTIVEIDGAFLEDIPAVSFGNDRGSRTWTWQYAAARVFLGGHDAA